MKKLILPLLSIVALANASAVRADCLPIYKAEISTEKANIAVWESSERRAWGQDQYEPAFDVSTRLSSSGIPDATYSTKVSEAESKIEELSKVSNLIKEAQVGGGVAVIKLKKTLDSKAKVDLDSLASIVRDANDKNYFCSSDALATYEDVKLVVENMLAP